jgi:hypothetical protein
MERTDELPAVDPRAVVPDAEHHFVVEILDQYPRLRLRTTVPGGVGERFPDDGDQLVDIGGG